MQVFESVAEWRKFRAMFGAAAHNDALGFVPTMGALHAGHLSLVERSRSENAKTLVSIFVNPTQFNDPADFRNYPKTLAEDLKYLEKAKVDFLITPKYEDLYEDGYRFQIHESELSQMLCGAHRPGHFTGVLTVVMKLLNLAGAQRAYFGEKDYQQFLLIRDMARALFVGTEILSCPTVREADGLAMSSRNTRLKSEERKKAAQFAKLLKSPKAESEIKLELQQAGFRVDYIEKHFGRRFGAVVIGDVRLIDNVEA